MMIKYCAFNNILNLCKNINLKAFIQIHKSFVDKLL